MNIRLIKTLPAAMTIVTILALQLSGLNASGPALEHIVTAQAMSTDTIPLQDRYGDFITDDYYNPFDITPSNVEQTVEYDMNTGQYIVMEKIGDQYYRTPTYMTLSEYLKWQEEKQRRDYQRKLSGIKPLDHSQALVIDPMADLNVEELLVNRLFGGTEFEIKPTGSVQMDVGYGVQILDGVNITPQNRVTPQPIFEPNINIGIDGKIGEKMNIGFNFNSAATFNFDNRLNLGYLSDALDEDGIIKGIEAGNVSFPLKSELINGSQDLFGLKTELQFGHLRLTGVISQSRSQAKSITLENGKLIQEFELRPDDYDENRHFFISHYNRNNFESAMSTIPQVRSLMRITNIEVWVSTQRNDNLQNATTVAAIADLGEADLKNYSNPNSTFPPTTTGNPLYLDVDGNQLPDNDNSQLFGELVADMDTRKIVNTTTQLAGPNYMMQPVRDFEVQTMRKLNSSEFTFYPELGFISLNSRLRPNQVLGVAYEYTYSLNGSEVYKVGELSNESNTGGLDENDNPEPEDVIYVKMLKSSNQRVDLPTWDLMMKNIYSLNTSQLSDQDFELDIFFEDTKTSTIKRFIPEAPYNKTPLLDLFQLDRLNSRLDPQSDGIFDYVPGVTVNTRTGSIIFPVLQPFGSSLLKLLGGNQQLYAEYGFPELYDNAVTIAREQPEKNRFVMVGQYNSNSSSEIRLGAFNIPRGSVTVRAGSQILREGIDYDIDYGIGRIKIINGAYLQQGAPITVDFEDKDIFGQRQRNMFGLRAEYDVSDDFVIGGTYMRLSERPFSQKVNIGEDPINNRMFGLDMTYTADAPFLTNLLDKLPFYSTSTPSSVSVSGEIAAIKPGHNRNINVPGEDEAVVSIDDFEGATSSIPLGSSPGRWKLASTPANIRNSNRVNDLTYNYQRALINWYVVNNFNVRSQQDNLDPYTREVRVNELFAQRQIDQSQLPILPTFDISYYPSELGPYNFNTVNVEKDPTTDELRLSNPRASWAGIMRYIDNNDFQASNIQYIEFWMLNPFMDRRDGPSDSDEDFGRIVFNLGNVSEDILKDNLQFYENSIALEGENVPIQNTVWGNVPLTIPSVDAFDRTNAGIQDLGFDGLSDSLERLQYRDYVNTVEQKFGPVSVSSDPSNDNFVSFLDERYQNETNLLNRYKRFNNPQGNVSGNQDRLGIGNPRPDTEDLNGNRSLEQSENYYEYAVPIANDNGRIQGATSNPYITDIREISPGGDRPMETWYRFRIPIEAPTKVVGNIQGFRSIQFMRMYLTGFTNPKTFRLTEFELVRSQWRRLAIDSSCLENRDVASVEHVIDEVGIEENAQRAPFNYILPKGIKRERFISTLGNLAQDENSMSVRVCNLPDSCEAMVYKLTEFDMRQYKRLQMFVHAEARDELLQDDEFSVFIRLGRDFKNNYYEYELPMTLSKLDSIINMPTQQSLRTNAENQIYNREVWRPENMFDVPLKVFTDAKIARNLSGVSKVDPWVYPEGDKENNRARITIKGNPTLGFVKGIVLGIRSKTGRERTLCTEVWFNELRLKGFNDRGGIAGVARVDMQLADLGNLTMSGNFSTIGFGQIDQQLQDRQLDQVTEYDIATNLELGKFFPQKWGLRVPFYYQYNKTLHEAEYDPYELDLKVDTLKSIADYPNIEDIDDRSKQRTEIKTLNFTNVRKERTSSKSPKPWNIENVSVSYAHTQTTYSDDILRSEVTTDQRTDLNYAYTPRTKSIKPFKGVKAKSLKFIKEINFNPIPSSFAFNTQLRRYKNVREYRLPDPAKEGILYAFDDQRYNWTRNYTLGWDLAKSIKINYDASASSVIDELRQVGVAPTAAERGWENEYGEDVSDQVTANANYPNEYRRNNLSKLGRLKNFTQGLSINYTLPFKYLPGLDWISARASYNGNYTWNAGSLGLRTLIEPEYAGESPWNNIQNNQSRNLNATFSFDKLYNKSPYLKRLQGSRQRSRRRSSSRSTGDKSERQKEPRKISVAEKILLRPLLAVREFRFTYRENLSTVVPGFSPVPKTFGLAGTAPGVGFVFGLQPDLDINNPDNWLNNAAGRGWITPTRFQNQQVLQNSDQTLQGRLKLEPWKDFVVDVKFEKAYTRNHAEDFVNRAVPGSGEIDLQQVALRDLGSYRVSFLSLNTLFNDDINGLFRRFESYQAIISNRLPNNTNDPHVTDKGFAQGYGRQHIDVLIPAFLAAYTGKDPETINLNLTEDVSRRFYIPMPNWQLQYNGLSRLGWFKDIFSNISISHGYNSTLSANNYQSDLQYKANDPYFIDPDISTGNYFARFEIPELLIEERFQPIIGIDIQTHSALTATLQYARSRTLKLSSGLGQMNETRSKEITAGLGWILDDVNIGFLSRKRSSRRRRPRNVDNTGRPEDDAPENAKDPVSDFPRRLEFRFDFSLRDDATYTHELQSRRNAQATRGTYTLQINPTIEYDINKYFTLGAFFEYNQSKPKTLGGYDVTNIRGGLRGRFNLQ